MDFVCGEDYKPLIPDGTYQAQCIRYDESFCLGKARKLFLHFRIVESEKYHGQTIFMPFNMPYDKRIKQGSKYYKTWVQVNGYQKPSRNATMSPRLFKNKVFQVRTRTVKPKNATKEMPKQFWYSVVDSIVEVLA
jgi:hypothetical protein